VSIIVSISVYMVYNCVYYCDVYRSSMAYGIPLDVSAISGSAAKAVASSTEDVCLLPCVYVCVFVCPSDALMLWLEPLCVPSLEIEPLCVRWPRPVCVCPVPPVPPVCVLCVLCVPALGEELSSNACA
jgi:hypothetical protein